MTVAPLIAMKSTKCESLEAVGKELDRRAQAAEIDRQIAEKMAEIERLDGLRWQLKTSPEGSGREVRG